MAGTRTNGSGGGSGGAGQDRGDLLQQLGNALDGWRAKIDELRVQLDLADLDVRDEIRKRLDTAQNVYLAARSRLSDAQKDAGANLGTVRQGEGRAEGRPHSAGTTAVRPAAGFVPRSPVRMAGGGFDFVDPPLQNDHDHASGPMEENDMYANVGDRIIIHGHRSGEPDRDGEILEVQGQSGAPPYLVRWGDSGHEAIFFPGSDATVQHFGSETTGGGPR